MGKEGTDWWLEQWGPGRGLGPRTGSGEAAYSGKRLCGPLGFCLVLGLCGPQKDRDESPSCWVPSPTRHCPNWTWNPTQTPVIPGATTVEPQRGLQFL